MSVMERFLSGCADVRSGSLRRRVFTVVLSHAKPVTWNKVIALESARKIRQYPITQFATGHGVVRLGGQSALSGSLLRANPVNGTDRKTAKLLTLGSILFDGSLHRQIFVNERDSHTALSDSAGYSLHRTMPHVPCTE